MDDSGDLFVSCVDGSPVTRFGSRVLIGADRDTVAGNRIDYRPEQIILIPAGEHSRYRREYARQISDGALRVRTREEYETQEKAISEAERKHAEEKEARRKAREDEARAAAELNPHDAPPAAPSDEEQS